MAMVIRVRQAGGELHLALEARQRSGVVFSGEISFTAVGRLSMAWLAW
jgi:hypothetical protein